MLFLCNSLWPVLPVLLLLLFVASFVEQWSNEIHNELMKSYKCFSPKMASEIFFRAKTSACRVNQVLCVDDALQDC